MWSKTSRIILISAFLASPVAAQDAHDDAWVMPWGMIRAQVGADYAVYDTRFGSDWSSLLGALQESTFPPLGTLAVRLGALYQATGAPAPAEALQLGTPELDAEADRRIVPMGVAIGVLPRIELSVVFPIHREETQIRRLTLPEANVGLNPDPAGNAAAFSTFGDEFFDLGASTFLPIDSSTAGKTLLALAAEREVEIFLPASSAGADEALLMLLTEDFGIPAIGGRLTAWRAGDATAAAKVQLLSTMGQDPFPRPGSAFAFRSSATAGIRIATGTREDSVFLIDPTPPVGLSGWLAGAAADLFIGRAASLSASVRHDSYGSVERVVRVQDPTTPWLVPAEIVNTEWAPGSETRIRISPRVHLDPAVSIGAEFESVQVGDGEYTAADGTAALQVPGGTLTRFGGTFRFTTLPGHREGAGVLPMEAAISYWRDASGPMGQPEWRTLSIWARVYHRVWGGW